MAKLLAGFFGSRRNKGFERVGSSRKVASNQLEMDAFDTYHSRSDDEKDDDAPCRFEFCATVEYSTIHLFEAFDYDSQPQFFRRHMRLCYIVDKNVLSFAVKRVAGHLRAYPALNNGIGYDISVCGIDPKPIIAWSKIECFDYPMRLNGDVPESAVGDIIAREDSVFFRDLASKLRDRECAEDEWAGLGIYHIPPTLVSYVCMKATRKFISDANDVFTLEDVADFCIESEKRHRRAENEQKIASSGKRRRAQLYDSDDSDSAEYDDMRSRFLKETKLSDIFRLNSVHRWYRLPHWMLDFATTCDSDDSESAMSSSELKLKVNNLAEKKMNVVNNRPIEPRVEDGVPYSII